MKILKPLFLLFFVLGSFMCRSQDMRRHSFGIYQSFYDYNSQLLDGPVFAFDSALSQSLRISYQYRLGSSWEFLTGIANGFNLNQSIRDTYLEKAYTLSWDIGFAFRTDNGRLFSEQARISPFAQFAYRMDYIPLLRDNGENPLVPYNQYGLGINLRLGKSNYVQFYTGFDQKLGADFNTLMHYRLGFQQLIGPKKSTYVPVIQQVYDDLMAEEEKNFRDSLTGLVKEQEMKIDSQQDSMNQLKMTIEIQEDRVKNLKDSLLHCSNVSSSDTLFLKDTVYREPPSEPSIEPVTPGVQPDYDSLGIQYYVVALSTKDQAEALELKKKLEETFDVVEVFSQSNGYYRVGVYAGSSVDEASLVLIQVRDLGYEPVWITRE